MTASRSTLTPADIAEMVAFLAGPGHWVNGQVIRANGGVA